MTLKIYGVPRSRTFRTLWMTGELGIDSEIVPVQPSEASGDPALLAVNPFAKIPTIDDDGCILWESFAINHYLAAKHGGPLAPASVEEQGQMLQWSFWGATMIEPSAFQVVLHRVLYPEDKRDEAKAAAATEALEKPFGILDRNLSDGGFLVGGRFTVADLNLASILAWTRMGGMDLAPFPKLADWLNRCLSRSASRRAQLAMRR